MVGHLRITTAAAAYANELPASQTSGTGLWGRFHSWPPARLPTECPVRIMVRQFSPPSSTAIIYSSMYPWNLVWQSNFDWSLRMCHPVLRQFVIWWLTLIPTRGKRGGDSTHVTTCLCKNDPASCVYSVMLYRLWWHHSLTTWGWLLPRLQPTFHRASWIAYRFIGQMFVPRWFVIAHLCQKFPLHAIMTLAVLVDVRRRQSSMMRRKSYVKWFFGLISTSIYTHRQ